LVGWQKIFSKKVSNYLGEVKDIKYSYIPLKINLFHIKKKGKNFSFKALASEIKLEDFRFFPFKPTLYLNLNKPEITLNLVKTKKIKGGGKINFPSADFRGKFTDGSLKLLMEGVKIEANKVDGEFKKIEKTMIMKLSSKELKLTINDLYKISGFGELSFSISDSGKLNFRKIKLYSGNLYFTGRGRIYLGEKTKYSFTLLPQGELTQIEKDFLLPFIFEGMGSGEIKIFSDSKGKAKTIITAFGKNGNIGNLKIKEISAKIEISQNIKFKIKMKDTSVNGIINKDIMNLKINKMYFNDFLNLYEYSLPFESLCDANIRMNFKTNNLTGKAICNDNFSGRNPLKLKGDINFYYNLDKELLSVKAEKIFSEEDSFSYNSVIDFKKERYEDINFSGNFKSLKRYLNPIFFFTEIDFSPWKPEADGIITLKGKGNFLNPELDLSLNFKDFLSQGVYIGKLKAKLKTKNKITKGIFNFSGTKYSGYGDIKANKDLSEINLSVKEADIKGINKILELELPIGGRGEGKFKIKLFDKEKFEVNGSVKGDLFTYGEMRFKNFLAKIESKQNNNSGEFSLKNIDATYNGGEVKGSFTLSYINKKYDSFNIDISGKGIKVSSYIKKFSGETDIKIKGKGKFSKDPLLISGKIDRFKGLSPTEIPLIFKGISIPFENSIRLNLKIHSEDNKLLTKIKGEINWKNENLLLDLLLNTKDINYILPWKYNVGELKLSLNISGNYETPVFNGFITAKGDTLVIPDYSQSINNFDILAIIRSNNITISKFKGILGGGEISGGGIIRLKGAEIKDLNINFQGNSLKLMPMERVKGIADTNINLKKEGDSIKVSGLIFVNEMEWQREFEEGISFSSSPEPIGEQNDFMKIFNFDVNFVSNGNSWVRNSLFEGEIKYDFHIRGNYLNPVIIGNIKVKKGFMYFSDQKFNIIKGDLIFDNPYYINPRLNIISESYIKDYRVNFSIKGYYDHPIPELTSSPPLPPQEVLTLIAMGESYRRSYSSEIANMQSSSTLIASSFTGIINSLTPKKFRPDIIRVYPFMNASSSEPSPRIAVGNKIAKNLFVIYTFDLTNQNNYMVYGEYSLSRNISLIAYRDENGYYSLEFRIVRRRK